MTGQLFTDYFLTVGIKATEEWRDSDTAFAAFRATLSARYRQFSSHQQPNEATTEQELIRPVLEALGWTDHLPQQGTTGNEDIPDNLLFIDAASKDRAASRPNPQERYQDAAVVEESKQFGLKLDAITKAPGQHSKTPHSQILQYLSTAEIASESRIRWGFLTNGGVWRLYDQRARPRATGYFEADLGQLLDSGDAEACAPSTCCSAATRSPAPRGPPPPSSSTRWPRAAATRSRWRGTSLAWSSIRSSPGW